MREDPTLTCAIQLHCNHRKPFLRRLGLLGQLTVPPPPPGRGDCARRGLCKGGCLVVVVVVVVWVHRTPACTGLVWSLSPGPPNRQ